MKGGTVTREAENNTKGRTTGGREGVRERESNTKTERQTNENHTWKTENNETIQTKDTTDN